MYTLKSITLMKEIKEDKINGKLFRVHWLEILILLKCSYNPKQSTGSMQSLSKFQCHFCWNRTINPKFCMEPQKSLSNLEKDQALSHFLTYITWFLIL